MSGWCLSIALLGVLSGPEVSAPDEVGPRGRGPADNSVPVIDHGYLFLDGHYLPPPYTVVDAEEGDTVIINDHRVPADIILDRLGDDDDEYEDEDEDRGFRRGAGRFRRPPFRRSPARSLRQQLDNDDVVVIFSDERMITFNGLASYPLFKVLAGASPDSETYEELMNSISRSAAPRMKSWIASYEPPSELLERTRSLLESVENSLAQNESHHRASRRYEAIGYPLTVLGMVFGVLALGHLLMSAPNKLDPRSEVSRAVVKATLASIAYIAMLSGLDLIWTLMASQAGQMKELNPIGSHLIDDPNALIGFKLAATFVGCGLLLIMRQHSRAQEASWWLCLICTVLTFRWLLFNSMFMA